MIRQQRPASQPPFGSLPQVVWSGKQGRAENWSWLSLSWLQVETHILPGSLAAEEALSVLRQWGPGHATPEDTLDFSLRFFLNFCLQVVFFSLTRDGSWARGTTGGEGHRQVLSRPSRPTEGGRQQDSRLTQTHRSGTQGPSPLRGWGPPRCWGGVWLDQQL